MLLSVPTSFAAGGSCLLSVISFIAAQCTSQVCLKYEGFPSSKVTQIPQHGEKRERERSFLWPRPSMMRNDWGKKSGCGQVLVLGGGQWLVILAGVEKGMWGSWNV